MVWHAAIKFAYDGRAFMGSQRQPGERTVESELIKALIEIGAIGSVPSSRLRFASRTDRGVSALGNVAAFDTGFSRKSLLRAVNSSLEDVFVYGLAEVSRTFTPRRAKARWYRYQASSDGLDPEEVRRCGAVFEGRHDFLRFCKPEGHSTVRTLDSVTVSTSEGSLVIDLKAREFLRNMVRRMVAAMVRVGEGRTTVEEVMMALDGKAISFGLAPPQGLTLMDIEYDMGFEIDCPPTMGRRAEAYRRDAFDRLTFADMLLDRCHEEPT